MPREGHHPASNGRRAPARLTLRGTSSRNRTGVSSLWGKRPAAGRSWLESLEPPAGLAPTSLAYRARVLRLDEGGLACRAVAPDRRRNVWSRWRESNPRSGLTKTVDCRYPTPACLGWARRRGGAQERGRTCG